MEFVWVVPRVELFQEEAPQGFLSLPTHELTQRFLEPALEKGFFMERRYAESHPAYKQVIPYVVVTRQSEVFALTRLKTQGEKRLHGLRSIGVGGHINPCDVEGSDDLFHNACHRELNEEVHVPETAPVPTPLGLLKDDATEVGSVHVGIVYRLDAGDGAVSVRETTAMVGGFEPLTELQAAALSPQPPFETWSTLLLRSTALHAKASDSKAGQVVTS